MGRWGLWGSGEGMDMFVCMAKMCTALANLHGINYILKNIHFEKTMQNRYKSNTQHPKHPPYPTPSEQNLSAPYASAPWAQH